MNNNLRDFSRSQISDIAKEYSSTRLECSHRFFEEKYDISASTFYNLLNKAILISAVDDRTAVAIAKKAELNAFSKAGINAEIRSRKKFYYLMNDRKSYLPSKKEMIIWAKKYSESNLSKLTFAKSNCIEPKLLDRILSNCIKSHLITRNVFDKLKEKSLLAYGSTPYIHTFWDNMEASYNNYKKGETG